MDTKRSIIILGAGFGGLRIALLLGRKLKRLQLTDRYQITLIDRNDYHTYAPTLYEIATTSEKTANQCELKEIVTFPIRDIIKNLPIEFKKAEINSIDALTSDVHLTEAGLKHVLHFDYLILALGAQTNFFNIPGLAEYSLPLKTFLDALHIREKVILLANDREEKEINIVIGGGGSTGVELAGELKTWLCGRESVLPNTCRATITIVDSNPTILSVFDRQIIECVTKRLNKLGITITTNARIQKVTEHEAILENGTYVPFDLFFWTGGIKASEVINNLSHVRKHASGMIESTGTMECILENSKIADNNKIYGIGDAICTINQKTGQIIPQVARAALSRATIASHNIIERIKYTEGLTTRPNIKTYIPAGEYPYVIPVGGKWAVAKLGPIIISGFFGWVLKGLVEINYLLSIMPKWKAFKLWIKGLRIFIQNEQLG